MRRGITAVIVVACCAIVLAGVTYLGAQQPTATVVPPEVPVDVTTGLGAIYEVTTPAAADEDEDLGPPSDARLRFEARYPAQAAADADPEAVGGDDWALLIGINEHLGGVGDNVASRQDAERLRELLLDAGWADERIVLMTDTDATGDMIREGLAWLERSTSDRSQVVFHYSGHSKKWYGAGGEVTDQALWPADGDFVRRDELGGRLGRVRHAQLWGNIAACEAAGFHVPGVSAPDRVLTYSSAADEKSYEDPASGLSVWGRFLLDDALGGVDGTVSVQEAFAVAAPQARHYTSLQKPYGPQGPVIADTLVRTFVLRASPGRTSETVVRVTPPVAVSTS